MPSALADGNGVLLDIERRTFLNAFMLYTVHRLAYAFTETLELEQEMTCHTNFTRVLNGLLQLYCMQVSDPAAI